MVDYLKMSEAPNLSYLTGWNDCLEAIKKEHPETGLKNPEFVIGKEFKTIKDSEWIEQYEPVNKEMLTDYPDIYDVNKIWTQVEGDDGEMVVLAGTHFINRLGWWVTAKPHNFDIEVIDD